MILNFLFHFLRFLISIMGCIIIHELGHFIAAKGCHCGVDIVSLGFGRPFYRKEIKGTIYQITYIPLGGYTKLHDELTNGNDKDSFTNLPYHKKLLIAIAGCLTNILFGIVFYIIGLKIMNFNIFYFGAIGLSLGVTNLLPVPCLDGSYPYLVWLEKFYGKEKGYKLMEKICRIGFIILMTINILYLPYVFYLLWKGIL